jgi:antitoxin (DNA-binding transcriptional repressor) of toxin-antitoxin stability system
MSAMIPIEEAQAKLKELIDRLSFGEELVIIENQRPVAKLVGQASTEPVRPAPGLGKGSILYMAPDFDEPLEDFEDNSE